jgi:signal transduction histidine kinase
MTTHRDEPTAPSELIELRRNMEALQPALVRDGGWLRGVLDQLPHPVVIRDATGAVLLANRAALRIQLPGALAPRPTSDAQELPWERAVRRKEVTDSAELAVDGPDGSRVLLESCAPLLGTDGALEGAVSVYADITRFNERRARPLEEPTAHMPGLLSAIAALSKSVTASETATAAVEHGVAALSARSGGLWLLRERGTVAELAHAAGYEPDTLESYARLPLDHPTRALILDTLITGEPVWVESEREMARRYPSFAAWAKDRGHGAVGCLPLFIERRLLGAILFTLGGSRRFDEDERMFLYVLARHCAEALERARLYELERDARARAEAAQRRTAFLAEASRVLASSLEYETTLTAVANLAVPSVADWCVVALAEEQGGLRPVAVAHAGHGKALLARELLQQEPDLGAALGAARVARTGEPELFGEVSEEFLETQVKDPEHRRFFGELGLCSVMVVPMAARGRILGAVTLASAESGRRYERDDLEMAQHLARRAALAVENARLYRDAQQALRAREDFLAIASHDLRNPLAVVLMNAKLLLARVPEAQSNVSLRKGLEAIQRAAERMDRLIGDLLQAAIIEAGHLVVERQAADVAELVRQAAESMRPLAEQKSLRLEIEVPPRPLCVECDRERIHQVFSNLMGNAIKFTEAGGLLRIRAEAFERSVLFSVSDTGEGIPDEDLPHLFDRYWQAARTDRRGIGLGLFISKAIIEAHGGALSVQSQLGTGSTFTFSLPLPESEIPGDS